MPMVRWTSRAGGQLLCVATARFADRSSGPLTRGHAERPRRDGAMEAMLTMTKLDIAELERAADGA